MGSREAVSLTERQKAILIGKILGDGTLEKNGRHTRLKVAQGEAQKEYVWWMYQELEPFGTGKPYLTQVMSRYRKVGSIRFATFSLPIFDLYRELFYQRRRKIIPRKIGSLLAEPLSLAVWYMDDGYKRTDNSGLYLCTSSFNQVEHKRLQVCLADNFGIDTNVHFAGGYARLHIPSRSAGDFCDLVRPFVVPSLTYKLL